MQSLIYSCDAPDCDDEEHKAVEVPMGADARDFGVVTVTTSSKSIEPENSVKHLIGDCEELFMNGTISGFDLFTGDDE
jgi:hypothetical protein